MHIPRTHFRVAKQLRQRFHFGPSFPATYPTFHPGSVATRQFQGANHKQPLKQRKPFMHLISNWTAIQLGHAALPQEKREVLKGRQQCW